MHQNSEQPPTVKPLFWWLKPYPWWTPNGLDVSKIPVRPTSTERFAKPKQFKREVSTFVSNHPDPDDPSTWGRASPALIAPGSVPRCPVHNDPAQWIERPHATRHGYIRVTCAKCGVWIGDGEVRK